MCKSGSYNLFFAGKFSARTFSKVAAVFACCFIYSLSVLAQKPPTDSLERVLKTKLHDTLYAQALSELAYYYCFVKPDTAKGLAEKAIAEAKKLQNNRLIAESLRALATYHWQAADMTSAQNVLEEALSAAKKSGNLRTTALTEHTFATVLTERGNYHRAADLFFEAIQKYEKIGEMKRLGRAYNDLGMLFHNQDIFDKAKEAYLKNLYIAIKTGDAVMELGGYNNLGTYFLDKKNKDKNYDSAAFYFNKGLQINQKVKHPQLGALFPSNLASVYFEKKDYAAAEKYVNESLEICRKIGFTRLIVRNSLTQSGIFLETKRIPQAVRILEENLKTAEELGMTTEVEEILEFLHEAYEKNKQGIKAYQTLKRLQVLKDSLNQTEATRKLLQKESEYKEQKMLLEQQKKDIERDILVKEHIYTRNVVIAVLIAVALLAFVLIFAYLQKQKHNRLLEARNEEISHQKALVSEKNYELVQVNEELQQQHEELVVLNENLEEQKKSLAQIYAKLQHTAQKLNESIRYAAEIQKAVLPEEADLSAFFARHFILFRPLDIVSGDFYWFHRVNENSAYFALADCTGHGVPGAFMSFLGATLLHDEIVTRKTKKTPAEILLYLQDGIRSILRQDKKKNRDGMDISLCYFELLENEVFIRFAGAKTAIYAFDGSQLTDIKGERKHLGGGEDFVHFENRDFRFAKPLTLYLATDGYKDQSDFERKRIGTTGFKQILTEAVCLDFDSQKEFFERKLDAHQGDEEQRDDISLIALKF